AVSAAAATLFAIIWVDARQAQAALTEVAQKQGADLKALQGLLLEDERLLKTGKLEACNRSSKPIRIATVAVLYRDAEGKVRSVHSGSFGYPTWDLRPGERTKLTILRGQPDDWDGSAAVYTLQMIYQGNEPFVLTGFLSDTKDGCVNLFLD